MTLYHYTIKLLYPNIYKVLKELSNKTILEIQIINDVILHDDYIIEIVESDFTYTAIIHHNKKKIYISELEDFSFGKELINLFFMRNALI